MFVGKNGRFKKTQSGGTRRMFHEPYVIFRKRNGKTFTKRFSSRKVAAQNIKRWRNAGGKIVTMDNRYVT